MRFILLFIILFTLILMLSIYYLYRYSIDSPLRIPTGEAKQKLKSNYFDLVLDVRTDAEVIALGKYPTSVHAPASELEEIMRRRFRDKGLKIIIYCNTGQRARIAAEKLYDMGYKNVVFYAGAYQNLL